MNAPSASSRDRSTPPGVAQENTVLSPRFYTTDFAELDRIDVSSVREQWDELMAEMRADPNKRHFTRNDGVRRRVFNLPPELDKEFRDFLISSVTAEFSGCVLYAEMKKRAKNKDMRDLFTYMSRDEARHAGFINDTLKDFGIGVDLGFLTKGEEIHLLPAEVHLLRHLSVREDRLRALHHDLPPARAASGAALPSDLQVVREVVQRRVPPRRGVRAADARQPEAAAGRQRLWIRFFLLAVFATMYVRDHCRPAFHKAIGVDPGDYDFRSVPAVLGDFAPDVPADARSRQSRLQARASIGCSPSRRKMEQAAAQGGFMGRLRKHGLRRRGGARLRAALSDARPRRNARRTTSASNRSGKTAYDRLRAARSWRRSRSGGVRTGAIFYRRQSGLRHIPLDDRGGDAF